MAFNVIELVKNLKLNKLFVLFLCCLIGSFVFLTDWHSYRIDFNIYEEGLTETILKKNCTKSNNHKSDKWIVITTVSMPTEDIKRMAEMGNWTIVIVADLKTPNNWTYKNCIFLSIETQRKLKYKILQVLPYNSYTRKMIGYLYAIDNGAKFIYDTDDDNLPINVGLKLFDYKSFTSSLVRVQTSVEFNSSTNFPDFYNVYSHFGQPDVWPRGYPLEFINKESQLDSKLCHKLKTPIIQQGLVDQDADVDAIYRMVFVKNKTSGLNIKFDPTAPAITLGENIFCPFNSQNTLFHYEAFWALLLPVTVSFRVTDIWRGYWAQRLLHLIGNNLAFHGPNARQKRNPHSYFKDFIEEQQLYNDSASLVHALQQWQCTGNNFAACITDLSAMMVRKNFWGSKDLALTKAWISDLDNVGYCFPAIPITDDNSTKYQSCRYANFVSNVKQQSNMETVFSNFIMKVNNLCYPVTLSKFYTSGLNSIPFNHTKKVILVIIINRSHFSAIPLLQLLYEPWYSNMIFCGVFPPNFQNVEREYPSLFKNLNPHAKFSYVNLTDDELRSGNFGYLCLNKIVDMKIQNIDGYYSLADDMLFNFWNRINVDKINYISSCVISEGWAGWWNNPGTTVAMKNLSAYFQANPDWGAGQLDSDMKSNFMENILKRVICAGDIYYVPFHLVEQYKFVSQVFFDHRVFLEIAVGRILYGLGWANDVTFNEVVRFDDNDTVLHGSYLWGGDRSNPYRFYKETDHYLHPVKQSSFVDPASLKPFCNIYLKDMLNSLNGIEVGYNETL